MKLCRALCVDLEPSMMEGMCSKLLLPVRQPTRSLFIVIRWELKSLEQSWATGKEKCGRWSWPLERKSVHIFGININDCECDIVLYYSSINILHFRRRISCYCSKISTNEVKVESSAVHLRANTPQWCFIAEWTNHWFIDSLTHKDIYMGTKLHTVVVIACGLKHMSQSLKY